VDADKKRIWIDGQFVEVSYEVYSAYAKGDRKMRYFEKDIKTERMIIGQDGKVEKIIPSREDSLDRLMDDNAKQFANDRESVEDTVLQHISLEALHKAIALLNKDERELITALFFEGQTERNMAKNLGISQPAVQKRKNKILKKLKLFLEN